MRVWEGLSLTISSLLIIFCAVIIGLVRHNILQNVDLCCEPETACSEVVSSQAHIFYSPFTGLRARYIISHVFFFMTTALRCFTLPQDIAILQCNAILHFLGIVTFTSFLLLADITVWSFATSPANLLPACSSVSTFITNSIATFAWFVIILSGLLYYIFILTLPIPQKAIAAEFLLHNQDVEDEEADDSEEI